MNNFKLGYVLIGGLVASVVVLGFIGLTEAASKRALLTIILLYGGTVVGCFLSKKLMGNPLLWVALSVIYLLFSLLLHVASELE